MAFFLGRFGYSVIVSRSLAILGLNDEAATICLTVLVRKKDNHTCKTGKVDLSATYSVSWWPLFNLYHLNVHVFLKLVVFAKPISNSILVTSYPSVSTTLHTTSKYQHSTSSGIHVRSKELHTITLMVVLEHHVTLCYNVCSDRSGTFRYSWHFMAYIISYLYLCSE